MNMNRLYAYLLVVVIAACSSTDHGVMVAGAELPTVQSRLCEEQQPLRMRGADLPEWYSVTTLSGPACRDAKTAIGIIREGLFSVPAAQLYQAPDCRQVLAAEFMPIRVVYRADVCGVPFVVMEALMVSSPDPADVNQWKGLYFFIWPLAQ